MEDLLWGWLLRWELEEACAAVIGFDARLFDGALIRMRVEIVEVDLRDGGCSGWAAEVEGSDHDRTINDDRRFERDEISYAQLCEQRRVDCG